MATPERFLKLLAARTDDELEKEIEKMQDNQKNMLIKAFIKSIKDQPSAFDMSIDMNFED